VAFNEISEVSRTAIQTEIPAKLVKVGEPKGSDRIGPRPGGREPMSETGLVMVIFMVLTVMIVMSYSRQILLFMVAVAISLFCLGVYCLAMSLHG